MKDPTPLELMAFYDGELDEARAREVRSWLAANGEGAALVDNFRTLGRQVRRAAPSPAPPPDLTDRIFAALDAELAAPPAVPQVAPAEKLAPVLTLRPAAEKAADAAPKRTLPAARRALGWAPLSAAGMMFAAAASLLLWFSPGGGSLSGGPGASGKPTAPRVAGIDVDTVDFGAHMGSIYFVANDSQATPVLWIDDDDDDDGESHDTP
jgi:hypothetical protein